MDHPSHHHLLVLASPDSPYKCRDCKEIGFGQCYCCAPCDFYMHTSCARAEPYARHPFDGGCILEYRASCKLKACDACRKSIEGSRYRYKLGMMSSLDFHPCCLKLEPNIVYEGTQLRLVDHVSSKCLLCNRKSVTLWGGRGWSYVSSGWEICYHVSCVKDSILESVDNGTLLGQQGARRSSSRALARRSRRSSTAGRVIKSIGKVIFQAIISAISGDPTMGIPGIVVELLRQQN